MHEIRVGRGWTNYYNDLTKLPQLQLKELKECLCDEKRNNEHNKVGGLAVILQRCCNGLHHIIQVLLRLRPPPLVTVQQRMTIMH